MSNLSSNMNQKQDPNLSYQSKKDKFHLIRVPKGFDISKLNGVEFDPHQILEIQVKKGDNGLVNVFEIGSFTEQQMDLNVLLNQEDIVKIGPRIKQNFLVTKNVRLESAPTISTNIESKEAVSIPLGLRERFTPFGSVSPVKNSDNIASKHKKKKRHRHSDSSPESKRSKTSAAGDGESSENKDFLNIDIKREKFSPEKSKRRKKEERNGLTNGFGDSGIGNGSQSLDGSVHIKTEKDVKQDSFEESNNRHKKKKDRHYSQNESEFDSLLLHQGDVEVKEEFESTATEKKHKSKKKKKDKD